MTKILQATLGWVDDRFPLTKMWKEHLSEYYAPKNFNFWYFFGSLALMVLVLQIVTGIFLTMNYKPDAALAFATVEGNIMRDVGWGWLLRYMHSTGSSAFFIVVYLHMYRGLMYGSYKKPRELLWIFGMVIYVVLMAEAFLGYLLPWGNMSYWGAQVIVNLFSAVPYVGEGLSEWIRGDFVVDDATLNRFFAFHVIAVPLILLGLVVAHILALHEVGSNNPDGIEIKKKKGADGKPLDGIPFHPYYTVKDIVGVVVFLLLFSVVIFFMPEFNGLFLEHDNFVPANPLSTPEHIKPLWYFTPYYAILRAIPPMFDSQFPGVVAMGAAIVVLFFLPWIDRHPVKSIRYREPLYTVALMLFVVTFVVLAWLGMQPALPHLSELALRFSELYFVFFVVLAIYSQVRSKAYYLTWLAALAVAIILMDLPRYIGAEVEKQVLIRYSVFIPLVYLIVTLWLPTVTKWNQSKTVPDRVTT